MGGGEATGNMGIQGGRKGRDAEAVRDSPAFTRPLAAPEGLAVSPPDSESRESSSTWAEPGMAESAAEVPRTQASHL